MSLDIKALRSWRIEQQLAAGEIPHPDDLASLVLNDDPITAPVRRYIAACLKSPIKRNPGQQKLSLGERTKRSLLALESNFRMAWNEAIGDPKSREQTNFDVAEARDVTRDIVDKAVYPRRP